MMAMEVGGSDDHVCIDGTGDAYWHGQHQSIHRIACISPTYSQARRTQAHDDTQTNKTT